MGKGRKKATPFINKKHSTKFKLLHRSQKDPLIADNEVGERILHPIGVSSSSKPSQEELEERNKYGIFYRDDYNYLKHLKQVGEVVELEGDVTDVDREVIRVPESLTTRLSSVIFETKGVELKVGLLNQNAPNNELLPDIDPDIAAALEGDEIGQEDFDEELEDDFIQLANPEKEGGGDADDFLKEKKRVTDRVDPGEMIRRFGLVREKSGSFSGGEEDSCDDDEGDLDAESDEEENGTTMNTDSYRNKRALQKGVVPSDRRSHYTNYSMSSAVMKREGGLRLIDDHFEQLYEQYGDEEIGEGGDEEEVLEDLTKPDSDRLQPLVEAHFADRRRFKVEKPEEELKRTVLAREQLAEMRSEQTEQITVEESKRHQEWDCESILSRNSNIYNHPTLICPPLTAGAENLRKRRRKLTNEEDEAMETESVITARSTASTFRPKDETSIERRARKQLVKEERRERRQEKKATKNAFKQARVELNANQRVGGPQKIRSIK